MQAIPPPLNLQLRPGHRPDRFKDACGAVQDVPERRASRPEDESRSRRWLKFIPVEGWRCLRTQIAYARMTSLSYWAQWTGTAPQALGYMADGVAASRDWLKDALALAGTYSALHAPAIWLCPIAVSRNEFHPFANGDTPSIASIHFSAAQSSITRCMGIDSADYLPRLEVLHHLVPIMACPRQVPPTPEMIRHLPMRGQKSLP